MPSIENACSGTTEKPVTRSKLSRIRLYSEYFDSPAWRSSCPTTTSVGLLRELVGQRRDEGVHLVALVDQLHHVAAVGAHHAALVGHHDAREAAAQPVHRARGPAAPGRVVAVAADRADVVVALVHRGQQQVDVFGRVLQVGVERDDALAAAMLEAGQDGAVLAEVAVEQDHPRDIGPALELLGQQRRRAVAAAVVDEDDFVGDPQRIERRDRAAQRARASPASSL